MTEYQESVELTAHDTRVLRVSRPPHFRMQGTNEVYVELKDKGSSQLLNIIVDGDEFAEAISAIFANG